jgi:hypothetical protein
MAPDE